MRLTRQQRDHLEDCALKAFTGSLGNLVNGFRIQTPAGQVAAIYWSDLAPGNELEIALAPVRLTERYDLVTTLAWVSALKAKYPAPCNVHKHGSDWPIFGVSYAQALSVLADCQRLRTGWMSEEQVADIDRYRLQQSPLAEAASLLNAQLESLRPRARHAVIDLVRQAKVSVQRWHTKADGTPAANPRSNPAYCYDWSFGGGQEPSVACLWHASMKVVDGHIEFVGNLLSSATRLEQIAADTDRPVEHRERARPQAARARRLDKLLRECHGSGAEVRVIVNEGNMRDESALGEESSWVKVRLLDPVAWNVLSYDLMTGECRLRRKPANSRGEAAPITAVRFADQHDLLGADAPERGSTVVQATSRDPKVRLAVLERADGHCELCDTQGFLMDDGRLYLETHHVQPLGKGGKDRVWNVVGLCPNHHREAHHGKRRSEITNELVSLLTSMYPDKGRDGPDMPLM